MALIPPHSSAVSRRRTLLAFVFAPLFLGTLAGCETNGQPAGTGGKDAGEILIGHFASLTGSEATFGQSTENGIQLAISEINSRGGVLGRPVRVITYDDKGDAREAGSAVTRLVSRDGVVAVLGEVASGLSLAGAPICQEAGVPMVSPSSTNPKVTKVGDMIFRVCFIDPFQGKVCAKFAREHESLRAAKAAILFDQASPYSVGLQEEFGKAFESLGGEIVAKESYNAGDQDFSSQLVSIRAAGPEVVFVPGYYTEVGNIALQARKLELTVPLLGGDGWDSAKLGEIGGEAINGSFYSNHYSQEDPSPRVQDFLSKYKAKHGSAADALGALGYDSAAILCAAIERAGSTDGAAVAAELAKTTDFDGVTGRITMDAQRNPVKPAVILEMRGGTPRYITTIEPGA